MSVYAFVNDTVSVDRLTMEIEADSTIVTDLQFIKWNKPEELVLIFSSDLAEDEQTALNSLVASHSGEPLTVSQVNEWHLEETVSQGKVICRKWWGSYDGDTDTYSDLCIQVDYGWTGAHLDNIHVYVYASDGTTVLDDYNIVCEEAGNKKIKRGLKSIAEIANIEIF